MNFLLSATIQNLHLLASPFWGEVGEGLSAPLPFWGGAGGEASFIQTHQFFKYSQCFFAF